MMFLVACASVELPADVVVQDARVHTMDATGTVVAGFAVRGGEIVYVGDDVEPFVGPDTQRVSLGGRAVLPGFHDTHTHLIWSGADLLMVDLYSATTVSQLQATVTEWAAAHPEEPWVQGGGWDTSTFYGQIDKATLDAVVTDRPAYVYSSDAHIGLASSLALAEAGITADTPDPDDGTIERDADGNPTGILLEGAMSLVDSLIPPYAESTVDDGLVLAQTEASSFGITTILDANVDDWMLAGYQRADAAGKLDVRVFGLMEVGPDDTNAAARLVEWQAEYGSNRVEVFGAKLYLDGIIESQTAYMLEPYVDGTNAEPMFTDAELQARAAEVDAAGFSLHAHAIGDGAVRQFLDAVEVVAATNGVRDRRPSAAHLEVIDPADHARFAELGVIASFQALWAYPDSYIQDLTWPVIGEARSEWLYPIGHLYDAGASVTGGSDYSVTSQDPFLAIEVAVTRQDPIQDDGLVLTPEAVVDIEAAIRMYTSEAAYATGTEALTGSIEVGKRADFVVLGQDPFVVDPYRLSDIAVRQTWIDGKKVYDAASSAARTERRARRAH